MWWNLFMDIINGKESVTPNAVSSRQVEMDCFTVKCTALWLTAILYHYTAFSGPGSSVGIATGYGLDRPGIESRWGARFSAPTQTGPGAHPASRTMVTGSFPGGKERPGRDADHSPPSSAMVMKEQSYTSTPPMGRTACTEPQCLYKGDRYLYHTAFNFSVSYLFPFNL